MPNHIIPQKYLHGFTDNNSYLWTYQKDEIKMIYAHPKKTGAEKDYYSDKMEKELNLNFEIPTIPILDSIRAFQPITSDDKQTLSRYIINMFLRVPYSKERIKQITPNIINQVLWNYARSRTNETGKNIVELQHQLKSLRLELEKPNKAPDLFEIMLEKDRMKYSLDALSQMTWQFLTFESSPAFITSDNPVFFFSDIGIGNKASELVFPISENIVLWASWQQNIIPQFSPVDIDIVTEINRRTAFTATRFIYFATEENWVKEMIKETTLTLRRIIITNEGHHKLVLR